MDGNYSKDGISGKNGKERAYRKKRWRRKKKNPYRGPLDVGDLVPDLLNKLNAGDTFRQVQIARSCIDRLDSQFARHMLPYSFHKGTLYCLTDSPVWNQQYTAYKPQIIEKMNIGRKGPKIEDIRFKVGNFDEFSYILRKSEHTKDEINLDAFPLEKPEKEAIHQVVDNIESEDFRASAEDFLKFCMQFDKYKESQGHKGEFDNAGE